MSGKIYKQMSEVMKDIGAITKDNKNLQQGFKFRSVDQFVNSLYPALTKHGVFMTPRCVSERYELKNVIRSSGKEAVDKHVTIMMEYDFFAEDGSKVTVGPVPAEGLDSGDKATNKALSAALKYALIQTFSIPTEDMAEADRESPEIGVKQSINTVENSSTTVTVTNITPAVISGSLDEALSATPKVRATFKRPTKPTPNSTATTEDL